MVASHTVPTWSTAGREESKHYAKMASSSALLRVDEALFKRLAESGHIGSAQADLLTAYYRDPHAAMRTFLLEHPDFLQNALRGDNERTRARAQLLVDGNVYGLNV